MKFLSIIIAATLCYVADGENVKATVVRHVVTIRDDGTPDIVERRSVIRGDDLLTLRKLVESGEVIKHPQKMVTVGSISFSDAKKEYNIYYDNDLVVVELNGVYRKTTHHSADLIRIAEAAERQNRRSQSRMVLT